jgi:cation diffusion facilitator family transporter
MDGKAHATGRRCMAESKTAVVAALLGNVCLAVLKGVSAAFTGSAAMLAETFHSIADTGNQALLFLGMHLGTRPPDRRHPFGHGKNVYFWAFVVSVMLFSLGGAFSIWEGVRKYLHAGEHPAEGLMWAYGVLAGGFVFEAMSLGVALHTLRQVKSERTVWRYWRDNRDPTLPTVVLEDTAALLSLAVAAAGLTLAHVTGNVLWDAAASATIGVTLVIVAVFLAIENYSLLIGEAAPDDVENRIRTIVSADTTVTSVVALHTMHVGPHDLLIVVTVDFRDELSAATIEAAVARLHERIAQGLHGVTNTRLVVIEPASWRPVGAARTPRTAA